MYMIFACEYKAKALEWKRDLAVASPSAISILAGVFTRSIFFMNYWLLTYLDQHLKTVAGHLTGQQLFVVGGAVRDILLGVDTQPHDIDMTLAMHPEHVFAALQNADREIFSLFRTEKFGTVTLIHSEDKTTYELTPFREESSYEDHRHPDDITWSNSLLSDAKRRDFTINCIYYTNVKLSGWNIKLPVKVSSAGSIIPILSTEGWYYSADAGMLIIQAHDLIDKFFAEGKFQEETFVAWAEENNVSVQNSLGMVIDPFLGIQDLSSWTLRAVWDPDKRFQEDALRILRAVRIVNTLNQKIAEGNFDFEKETWKGMQLLAHLVPWLAKERLHQEVAKVFSGNNPFGWVALIDELKLLEALFPALYRNKHDDQPVRYHPFDTYSHILLTLWHIQQINDDYLVKLAMLYHDVGKKDQYEQYALAETKEEQQEIHSSRANHVVCWPEYAEKDFRELGFSNKEIEEIKLYVALHMRPGQILTARPDNQIKRVRQLLSEYWYERVKNLLDITVADRRGQFNPLQSREVDAVQWLYDILEKLYQEEWQFTMRDLAVNGDDIMQEFDLKPWPEIKNKLQAAFDRVLSDIAGRNIKETIITYLRSLDK